MSHRPFWFSLSAVAVVACLVVGGTTPVAAAQSYPSWAEVLAARADEAKVADAKRRVSGALDGLRTRAEAAESAARTAGDAFAEAQDAADRVAARAERLRGQERDAKERADSSGARAGQLSAQLSRRGGLTESSALLTAGQGSVDELLYGIGSMQQLTARLRDVEAQASATRAVAESLAEQSRRAQTERAELADAAASRMRSAQSAADAAGAAVAEHEEHQARLQAQLATLETGRVHAEAAFQSGVRAREKAAAEAAAAAAAAAARPHPGSGGSGGGTGGGGAGGGGTGGGGGAGGGAGGGGGGPAPSGWTRPGPGGVVSAYGYRVHPITGVVTFHAGTDMAAGCNTGNYAASAGTVEYVGWFGGYGNYVRIDHGNGVKTAYGHIVNGGYQVRVGQQVSAGQLVALVGTTGASTGCHIHFETHVGGSTTNPVAFMAARGVSL